jgi:hypothetical protein
VTSCSVGTCHVEIDIGNFVATVIDPIIPSPNHVCRPLAQARPMPCARAHAEPRGCHFNSLGDLIQQRRKSLWGVLYSVST